jgi:hypothetical protein
MATPIGAFNNQVVAFLEELAETYPEEKDLRTAHDALLAIKKMNPKLIHSTFMEFIYPDFHTPVMKEDESYILGKAQEMLNGEYKEYAFAYLIFDKYWSTMSEANKKVIWNYCKVLVILGERAAGIRN